MTPANASLFRLTVLTTVLNPDRIDASVGAGVRPPTSPSAPKWRRLIGRFVAALHALSVSHPTPSEEAMSDLSSIDRPMR